MSQGRHSKTSMKRPETPRPSGIQIAFRLLSVATIVALLAVAGILLVKSLNRHGQSSATIILPTNPNLGPVELLGLGAYMNVNADALSTTVSNDATPTTFRVNPGETARDIATNLLQQGLITDSTLFLNYLRYYGLDVQLEAGTYQLAQSMTIPEIALTLTDAQLPEISIRITEGWRREQIADWIDNDVNTPFTGADFLAATGTGSGSLYDVTFFYDIPQAASLEGYLFPDTYRIASDATAQEFVSRMLENFDVKVSPELRSQAALRGLSLHTVLTIASIVEREAVVAEERPVIASVYLNRLNIGMNLEADPTVQYAMGYQVETGQWWNLNLTQFDYYAVDSPYNTYLYGGVPPGPIANPGLGSIEAVIFPAETPYLYFRKTCDNSGKHNFSVTYEEHLAYGCP